VNTVSALFLPIVPGASPPSVSPAIAATLGPAACGAHFSTHSKSAVALEVKYADGYMISLIMPSLQVSATHEACLSHRAFECAAEL
jgi:hypothetical protein